MQNGVLLLHKERGMTSHDCVFKVRKILHTKKVGHTGTLDPEVSGVLPICIGRATKIVEYLTDKSKTYDAEITIGFSTTTEDQTGEVVEEKQVPVPMSEDDIDAVLKQFEGTIEQIPPCFLLSKLAEKSSMNMQGKALKLNVQAVKLPFIVSSGQHLSHLKMERYPLDSPSCVQKAHM